MTDHPPSATRRRVLSGCTLAVGAVLAGCFRRTNVELVMEQPDDAMLLDNAAVPTTRSDDHEELVGNAIEQGTASARDTRSPVETGWPNEHDGSYYEVTADRSAVGEQTRFEIVVRPPVDDPDGETVSLSSLPGIDQALFDGVFPQPDAEDPAVFVGEYDSSERETSALVPDLAFDAVEYEGRIYPVEQGWERVDTIYEFTYEAELVAETDADFLSYLRSTYRFDLEDLSEAEREVVEEAIDERYFESDPDEGFESLVDRLHSRRGFNVDDHDGEWLVRYDGEEYWAYMRTGSVIDP